MPSSIHALSLLTPAQESQWLAAFRSISQTLVFWPFSKAKELTVAPSFVLTQRANAEAFLSSLGVTLTPPLAVVLEQEPTIKEIEQMRRQGVALLLVGTPSPELAEKLVAGLGQSTSWFKGVGQWARLPDVLQFVASTGRPSLITLQAVDAASSATTPWESQTPPWDESASANSAWYGRIYLENGLVQAAEVPGGQEGDLAVAEMLRIENGVVRVFETFLPWTSETQPRAVQSCLLNATYLLDESRRGSSGEEEEESPDDSFDLSAFSTPAPLSGEQNSPDFAQKVSAETSVQHVSLSDPFADPFASPQGTASSGGHSGFSSVERLPVSLTPKNVPSPLSPRRAATLPPGNVFTNSPKTASGLRPLPSLLGQRKDMHESPAPTPQPAPQPAATGLASLGLSLVCRSTMNGEVEETSGVGDAPLLAATALESQRSIDQITQLFGAKKIESWSMSTDRASFYCAAINASSVLCAQDPVSKSPHTALRSLELMAQRLGG